MNRVILAFSLMAFAPIAAGAQGSSHGYPNVDQALQVAPGETVRLLSRILVDRAPGLRSVRRMDFQVRSSLPPTGPDARAAQALRLAEVLGGQAIEAGARVLSVAFCDTEACARRAEPPREWYIFERGPAGGWQRVRN